MNSEVSMIPSGATIIASKSWTAYCGVIASEVLILLGGGSYLLLTKEYRIWVVLFLLGSLGFLAYRILEIRSHKLFYDNQGVWHSSGILPWTSGIRGVKWRDMGEAVFYQSALGWLTNSYSVRVTHRFTKSGEIRMSHTANGLQASGRINLLHQEFVDRVEV